MKIRVMTYNIASCRNYEEVDEKGNAKASKPERVADVIREISPDVCGLNEVSHFSRNSCESDTQTPYLAKATGLENHFFGYAVHLTYANETYNKDYGNAVISKHPIVEGAILPIPDPVIKDENAYYETRSITKAKIDLAGGITVLQTHMGLAIAESKNATLEILKALDEIDGPVILMGDFNMRPSNPLIDMLRERLFDTALIRDEYFKTYPSYKLNYTPAKLDYIFVSKHFKVLDLQVPQTSVSDHLPYYVDLEIGE